MGIYSMDKFWRKCIGIYYTTIFLIKNIIFYSAIIPAKLN
jgi:hypothetical protein